MAMDDPIVNRRRIATLLVSASRVLPELGSSTSPLLYGSIREKEGP